MNLTIDKIGVAIMTFLILLLAYAGYLSYQSIDFNVLKKLEATKLILPTPLPTQVIPPLPTSKK